MAKWEILNIDPWIKDYEDDINLRMKNARKELEYIKYYDYLVINDHINSAINSVNEIINAEKHKVFREEDFDIKEILDE